MTDSGRAARCLSGQRSQFQRINKALPALLWLSLLCSPACAPAASAHRSVALVFSVEQGFVNSPVQNEDVAALSRVANELARLKDRYQVFVTLGCAQSDQSKLLKALDVFSSAHIGFFLDTWSSDNLAPPRPSNKPVSTPFDRSHGLCQSTAYLQGIRNRYGAGFAGIRLHETFAANLSVAMFHQGTDWFPHASSSYPAGAYFDPRILEDEYRFAYRNRMKVIFSDPYWLSGGNHFLKGSAVSQPENERLLIETMRRYPGITILMYANNEPLKGGPNPLYRRIDDWSSLFPPALSRGTAGIGLSDQAWVCDRAKIPESRCDPKVVADWAANAVRQGAVALEFEPYWYFFDFPRPAGDRNTYNESASAAARGSKTGNFDVLISVLDRSFN